jgi:hypothetical protein
MRRLGPLLLVIALTAACEPAEPTIDPATAMPVLGLSQSEARHMAAFLYTLR